MAVNEVRATLRVLTRYSKVRLMMVVRHGGQVTRFLEAWFAARQMIQAANFNRFQGAGLSATQFMTLNLLPADGAGIAIGELARRMNLQPATVAKTVDSLELRKMIARVRGDKDRRQVLVEITAAGRALQNSASGQFREQIGALFAAMPTADRAGLIVGLESLVRAAGASNTLEKNVPNGNGVSRAPDADLRAKRSLPRSRRR